MQNICTSTSSKRQNVIAHLATNPAKGGVGAKGPKIAKNSPRLIAVLSVIKEDVSDLNLVNVVIYFVLEDVQDQNSQIAWWVQYKSLKVLHIFFRTLYS